MVTTELNRHHVPRGGWVAAYALVWASTLAATGLVRLLGAPAIRLTRGVLRLRLEHPSAPAPNPARVLTLAAHNLPVAAWPLLLGFTAVQRRRGTRLAAQTLVIAALIANTAPVGGALAAYGPRLLPYIPQLPLEWAALALGASRWLSRGAGEPDTHRLARLGAITGLLLIAAALETVAVPHR